MQVIDANEQFMFFDSERHECSIVIIETGGFFKMKPIKEYTEDEYDECVQVVRQRI